MTRRAQRKAEREWLDNMNARLDALPKPPLEKVALAPMLRIDDVKTGGTMRRMATTPVSNFRIPLYIKEPAAAKAEAEGKTLSTVVIDLLREYIREEK